MLKELSERVTCEQLMYLHTFFIWAVPVKPPVKLTNTSLKETKVLNMYLIISRSLEQNETTKVTRVMK